MPAFVNMHFSFRLRATSAFPPRSMTLWPREKAQQHAERTEKRARSPNLHRLTRIDRKLLLLLHLLRTTRSRLRLRGISRLIRRIYDSRFRSFAPASKRCSSIAIGMPFSRRGSFELSLELRTLHAIFPSFLALFVSFDIVRPIAFCYRSARELIIQNRGSTDSGDLRVDHDGSRVESRNRKRASSAGTVPWEMAKHDPVYALYVCWFIPSVVRSR